MQRCSCRLAIVIAGLVLLGNGAVPAQQSGWALGAEAGAAIYAGGPAGTDPSDNVATRVRPSASFLVALRVERRWQRLGVGLGVTRARAHPAVVGGPVTVIDRREALDVVTLTPELAWGLTSPAATARLRLHGGPSLELWRFDGTRARVGAHAALSLSATVRRGAELVTRLGAAYAGRPFDRGDLPAFYTDGSVVRLQFTTGLRIAL